MSTFLGRLGFALVGLGFLALWGVSAAANWSHAYWLARSPEWGHLFAAASLASDIVKAGALVLAVLALRRRLWTVAFAAVLVWAITTAWSVRSAAGVVAINFLDLKGERQQTVTLQQGRSQQLAQERKTLAWLQLQIAEKQVRTYRERQSLLKEIEATRRSIDKLSADLERTQDAKGVGVADPFSIFVRRILALLGVETDGSRESDLITLIGFVLLLEIASNLGVYAFSSLIRSKPVPPADSGLPAVKVETPSDSGLGFDLTLPKPATPTITPGQVIHLPRRTRATLSVVPAASGQSHLHRFVAYLLQVEGGRIRCADLPGHYQAFCTASGEAPQLRGPALATEVSGLACVARKREGRNGPRYYEIVAA